MFLCRPDKTVIMVTDTDTITLRRFERLLLQIYVRASRRGLSRFIGRIRVKAPGFITSGNGGKQNGSK